MGLPVRTKMRCQPQLNKLCIQRIYRQHQPYWRQYLIKTVIFALITTVVVVLVCLDEDFTFWIRQKFQKIDIKKLAEEYEDESTIYVDKKVADNLYKQVRVLCIILTTQSHLASQVGVVNATWARRCNKVLYALCSTKKQPDFLSTCMFQESKSHLIGKVRHAFTYAYSNLIHDYDWFLKADDDTYIVMENLRYLLSHHDSNSPGYLGYHFQTYMEQGYMSGGAGYVISRQGLRQLVENGFNKGVCKMDGVVEDVQIGKCLQQSKVPVLSSLDKFSRETFHTDKVWQHVWGTFPSFLVFYSRNDIKKGANCCSQFIVSFHHIDGPTMILIHHLLYRTSVYGRATPTHITDMFPVKAVPPKDKFDSPYNV